MKISNTASAVRVTLSPTEISDLQFVIEAAERAGHYMPARVLNIMAVFAYLPVFICNFCCRLILRHNLTLYATILMRT